MSVQHVDPLTRSECLQIAASYQRTAARCARRARRAYRRKLFPEARVHQLRARAFAHYAQTWRDFEAPRAPEVSS